MTRGLHKRAIDSLLEWDILCRALGDTQSLVNCACLGVLDVGLHVALAQYDEIRYTRE